MPHFTVVLRGPSAAIFKKGTNLHITSFPTASGHVRIVYATRFLKLSDKVSIPGQLWVEVQGQGVSLDAVLTPFANAGMAFLSMLSLSTNAHVGDVDVELAFDSTPSVEERQYFQQYLPPERGLLSPARPIDVQSTRALIDAVNTNANRRRLSRAANQYRMALESWHLGQSIESIAHLWMALEALTPVERAIQKVQKSATNAQELADKLGVGIKELDSNIRRQFLLEGDEESYQKAKRVSDGFEHGFAEYDELWELSKSVREQMARSVRKAILRLSGLENTVITKLTGPQYATPIGTQLLAQYLRGTLKGRGNKLAVPGNKYPFVKWDPGIKGVLHNSKGEYRVKWEHKLSPELAEGIKFAPVKLEVLQKT